MNAKDDLSINDLEEIAKEVSTERSEEIMTIAERLREEGKKEGEIEGKIEVAKKLLKNGMDTIDIMDVTELSKEKIEEIKRKTQH